MRRCAVIVALVAAALPAAGPAHAQTVKPPKAVKPPLRATLATCQTGTTPAERFAVVTGSMPSRTGTVRMGMRFDLEQRRTDADDWTPYPAPKFGRWIRSERNR